MPKLQMKNNAADPPLGMISDSSAPASPQGKSTYTENRRKIEDRAKEMGRVVVDNEGKGDCYPLALLDGVVSVPAGRGLLWIRRSFDVDSIKRLLPDELRHQTYLRDADLESAVRSNTSVRRWLNSEVQRTF